MPIENYGEIVRSDPRFNTLEIGELLFAEYTCPTTEKFFTSWSEVDHVIYALSGKKTWRTSSDCVTLQRGEAILVKKGCTTIEQFFDEDFCLIVCFLPDRFVAQVVHEMAEDLDGPQPVVDAAASLLKVNEDPGISGYFSSLGSYFSGTEKPSEPLLRVKLRELVVGMLVSRVNPEISAYLRSLGAGGGPSIAQIMENNFTNNLSMEEFAKICHRSLSTFKREFAKELGETPGRWLLNRRLEHAATLLRTSGRNVTEAAFESGFEDVSHFSRAFKTKFGESPSKIGT